MENDLKKKRKKLLEEFLNGNIEKKIYKITDYNYNKEETSISQQISIEQDLISREEDIKKKIAKFRQVLSTQVGLKEFDREIFECLIEKVIIGEKNEERNMILIPKRTHQHCVPITVSTNVEVVSLLQKMNNTRSKEITLDVDMEEYHRTKNRTEVTADATE